MIRPVRNSEENYCPLADYPRQSANFALRSAWKTRDEAGLSGLAMTKSFQRLM
jgi:hypothetical protein